MPVKKRQKQKLLFIPINQMETDFTKLYVIEETWCLGQNYFTELPVKHFVSSNWRAWDCF